MKSNFPSRSLDCLMHNLIGRNLSITDLIAEALVKVPRHSLLQRYFSGTGKVHNCRCRRRRPYHGECQGLVVKFGSAAPRCAIGRSRRCAPVLKPERHASAVKARSGAAIGVLAVEVIGGQYDAVNTYPPRKYDFHNP